MNGDEASFFCNTQEMLRLTFWRAGANNLYFFGPRNQIFALLYKYLYALNVKRTI